jgi:hypothetical protein
VAQTPDEHLVPGDVQSVPVEMLVYVLVPVVQQGLPGPPHAPALQLPLLQLPAIGKQLLPLATHRFPAQQPPSRQVLPEQQIWPGLPQTVPTVVLPPLLAPPEPLPPLPPLPPGPPPAARVPPTPIPPDPIASVPPAPAAAPDPPLPPLPPGTLMPGSDELQPTLPIATTTTARYEQSHQRQRLFLMAKLLQETGEHDPSMIRLRCVIGKWSREAAIAGGDCLCGLARLVYLGLVCPILLAYISVNQMLPSGPTVRALG